MRVLVVDDEPLSSTALVRVISDRHDVEAFEVAGDATEALHHLQCRPYDVLLLDIHMPEISGLQLIERLGNLSAPVPAVVFVTAYHEHAVEAFEKRALDYILKPFAPARVHEALDRATRRSTEERAARLLEAVSHMNALPRRSVRIALKTGGRVVFVDSAELVTAEAHGNYVLMQQTSGSYLLRGTIGGVAEKLKPYGFVRIHRSVLVNAAFVASIEPDAGGEYLLRMKTGKEYNVTRTYKGNLKDLAQFWIGVDGLATA
jgi:two-component system LytT family response regulator